MTEKKSNRGGKREGAGRPRTEWGKSQHVSPRVSRPVAAYLKEHGLGVVDATIRRTKHFRDWYQG